VDVLPLPLAALGQPSPQAFRKSLGCHAKTSFHSTLRHRQGVIEFRGIGEVAHAELVQPFQRTSLACAADHQLYFEFLRVHELIITSPVPTAGPPLGAAPMRSGTLGTDR